MEVAHIFRALGDPIRLEIVNRLSDGSAHTIGNLSKNLGVSRQGARKQIQVLESANIVQLKSVGRETRVNLDVSSLALAQSFIAKLENQWDERLQALKELAEK